MIKKSEYFIFNNIPSSDFGILNVSVTSGMQEEPFVSNRTILEDKVRGRNKPYFYGIEEDPLEFKVTFAFEDVWDFDKIRAVARWLTSSKEYKPLIFSDYVERIFYAVFIDESTVVHNSLNQGYVELNVRCNSPYSYSPLYLSKIYDWNETPISIQDNQFNQGESNNLITTGSANLQLNPVKTRWIDFSSTVKWADL